MYKGKSVIVLVPAFNEEVKIRQVVARASLSYVDTLLIIDDGSSDSTAAVARAGGAQVLSLGTRCGVGAALRNGLRQGKITRHDIAVIMAGNNKDDPGEIPRLLDPICDEDYDLVIGSRHLLGGNYGGDMPFYRKLATRAHPWLMSLFVRKRLTETTNGFRAIRLSLLDDKRIRLDQSWLNAYGLEVYLLYKALKLGYKHKEVPCTKIYPPKAQGYTKMKPVSGWWSILRPIFLLGLGIRN
ncbi:MAG: glycosyltransferase family 2 protein [Phycisphaerales bacterium]|nr:MAG: glycosyltransferase family 2 protein [Phycisphaerales bacterium]